MRWGVRRYQNKDGTLTPAGKARYSDDSGRRSSSGNDGTKSIHNLMKKPVSSLKNDIVGMDEATVALMAYIAVPVAIAIHATVKNRKFKQQKLNTLEELKDDREFKTIKDVPKLSKKETPDSSMKQTNPNYPKSGYTMNCARLPWHFVRKDIMYRPRLLIPDGLLRNCFKRRLILNLIP